MKTVFLIILSFILSVQLTAQTRVVGEVSDIEGDPLVGVNIYFKDTYDGNISGLNGGFDVFTQEEGEVVLVARFVGYQLFEQVLKPGRYTIDIVLKESFQSIEGVTVTAGSFAAGDKYKGSVMKSRDIYTTAGALGDVTGALNTLPGTQHANDDGRLLVRGGEAYETKTLIDGVLAGKPYYSKVPDVPTRGRFSPSLFSGVMFNTGGYSAEYGQALSSVLVLESNDLMTEDVLSLSLMSLGMEANYTDAWENNSISIIGSYINMLPYYGMVDTKLDWEKPTEATSGSVIYRHKTKKNGMLKAYFTADVGESRFKTNSEREDLNYITDSKNHNYYGNITYRQPLNDKTSIKAGVSLTFDHPNIIYGWQHIENKEANIEMRMMVVHALGDDIKLRYGVSHTLSDFAQTYRAHPDSMEYKPGFRDFLTGIFAETQIQLSKNVALSTGLRYEYSSLLKRSSVAPRLGIAMATGKRSQLSASYGHFYQNPHPDALKFSSNLTFESARHYILAYQAGRVDERFLRIESYYKKYSHLVKYEGNEYADPDYYRSTGYGEAAGVDVFWRDNTSIKNLEYWLSYSLMDTHRKYKNFDFYARPSFVSKHNASVVGKYWFSAIRCLLGGTYWVASGRNWYEDSSQGTVTHHGACTHGLDMNLSYLTQVLGNQTIVYLSLSNVLGTNNIYGYQQSPISRPDGSSVYLPIRNDIQQSAFIGIFITLK
ncbi:TonB-dependent receptor [Saccharicrinis fermentans]|uniref:Outer membrane cobalamin receptor protein n=1 Tax=Saccharicrinis fermentans DSM 9555 = JCM 21142 TaxID=869213 RepID=W7XZM9_9BACT|nr:TonB-dependent receptor [Saccharicrinis fermentans]GAF04120.1 outer membrane cobalamin receptor protein [Saccharicrinis fermentans DSM 9555 = JCM 21142]